MRFDTDYCILLVFRICLHFVCTDTCNYRSRSEISNIQYLYAVKLYYLNAVMGYNVSCMYVSCRN